MSEWRRVWRIAWPRLGLLAVLAFVTMFILVLALAGCEGDRIQGRVIGKERGVVIVRTEAGKVERIMVSRRQWNACQEDEWWPACQER